MLSCSDMDMSHGGHSMHGGGPTSPECRAGDSAYLTSTAWCMSTKCAPFDLPVSKLEAFWEGYVTENPALPAKWTYIEALGNVSQPPTRELQPDDMLEVTSLVPDAAFWAQFNTLGNVVRESYVEAQYGVAILVIGFALPIALTWLGYLPVISGVFRKLRPYLVYPSAIGTYQVRPLPYLLGNAPTIGQALFVAVMVVLNIVLTAVNYKSVQPNTWYANRYQEILGLVMFRTGTLSFCLLPLLILFAGRNNMLLWVTNWSHSTFMLLHRWVARLFAIQAILHSIIALVLYSDQGVLATKQKMPFWIWGAVATIATAIMAAASGLYVRRWSYETFLLMHIVLAVIVVVGCWYHIYLEFGTTWSFLQWLYAACAVWFADRLLRVARLVVNGVRRARIVELGDNIVRVDIDGVGWPAVPGQHAYLYFPTLNLLRALENHPFSIVPTAMLRSPFKEGSEGPAGSVDKDIEKSSTNIAHVSGAGITLFIRRSTGLTKYLKAHDGLLTLIDGPYPSGSVSSVLRCERVLLISGGIGVTGVLPWVHNHANAELFWSVRTTAECLFHAIEPALLKVEKDIRIGERFDVAALLREEAQVGWDKIGVVVCGPGGLCDDVRAAVTSLSREGEVEVELEVEAFSW
ncbi:ferric reductase transmembrane component 4 [Auricularia subglabra TFB-10046 SS5]|nr:ferric reductase transmembrane component 4 [Auricularia subglabra TFB-10046 SS5]